MYSTQHKCLAGCGKPITRNFAICADCEKIYGSSPNQWPSWLRFLWRDTLRERRQIRKQRVYETEFIETAGYGTEVEHGRKRSYRPAQ